MFILPATIMILVFSIFPLLFSLVLSFVSWDLSRLQGGIRFVGLQNFIQLFSDHRFWNTARATLFFVVGGVVLQYVVGLGIALLLNQDIRFRRFFRVVFLMPMMLTPAAVGYVGRMLFNQTQGPVNDIITHLGGPGHSLVEQRADGAAHAHPGRHLGMGAVHDHRAPGGTAVAAAGGVRGRLRGRRQQLPGLSSHHVPHDPARPR